MRSSADTVPSSRSLENMNPPPSPGELGEHDNPAPTGTRWKPWNMPANLPCQITKVRLPCGTSNVEQINASLPLSKHANCTVPTVHATLSNLFWTRLQIYPWGDIYRNVHRSTDRHWVFWEAASTQNPRVTRKYCSQPTTLVHIFVLCRNTDTQTLRGGSPLMTTLDPENEYHFLPAVLTSIDVSHRKKKASLDIHNEGFHPKRTFRTKPIYAPLEPIDFPPKLINVALLQLASKSLGNLTPLIIFDFTQVNGGWKPFSLPHNTRHDLVVKIYHKLQCNFPLLTKGQYLRVNAGKWCYDDIVKGLFFLSSITAMMESTFSSREPSSFHQFATFSDFRPCCRTRRTSLTNCPVVMGGDQKIWLNIQREVSGQNFCFILWNITCFEWTLRRNLRNTTTTLLWQANHQAKKLPNRNEILLHLDDTWPQTRRLTFSPAGSIHLSLRV